MTSQHAGVQPQPDPAPSKEGPQWVMCLVTCTSSRAAVQDQEESQGDALLWRTLIRVMGVRPSGVGGWCVRGARLQLGHGGEVGRVGEDLVGLRAVGGGGWVVAVDRPSQGGQRARVDDPLGQANLRRAGAGRCASCMHHGIARSHQEGGEAAQHRCSGRTIAEALACKGWRPRGQAVPCIPDVMLHSTLATYA